jgi:hypothetical protein
VVQVDAPEALECGIHVGLDVGLGRDVAADADRLALEPGRDADGRVAVEVDDHDLGALLAQAPRGGAAEAAGAAGDDRDATAQPVRHRLSAPSG